MKITYRHYRFSKYPQPDSEQYTGRHGVAYHYQRGTQRVRDEQNVCTKVRKTRWVPRERGGYTLCTIRDDDGSELAIGVAECSPLDPFCYRIGRAISLGRAMKRLTCLSKSS